MSRPRLLAVLATAALLVLAPAAVARDYADEALNVIPSGQYGSVPPPPGADEQARLYDALTPLRGEVGPEDLQRTFKSARLGLAGAPAPTRVEAVPRAGVTIVRDRFNVPHITGATRDDVTWATGWVAAEDRGLLLEQGRYPARLAAVEAPNVNAFSLVVGLKRFVPTDDIDRLIARQATVLRAAGEPGRALLHDIDVYVEGINARRRAENNPGRPFTRVDVFALNALLGQIFGQGGGGEVESAMLLDGLRERLGARRGERVWDDLALTQDPETPTTLDARFPYGERSRARSGSVVIDRGSYEPALPPGAQATQARPRRASNFLVVGSERSETGHPLFVAGPQVGYAYPGLTFEVDLQGPGFEARGVSAPGFPGNVLIGRGPDFAWSLTSAGSDNIDTYAETLCGGSAVRYRYRGRCRRMGTLAAGEIVGAGQVRFRTTVHGPVVGYARVGGRRVALSRKRASYGRDVLFQLPFRAATLNTIVSARSFQRAFAASPFTFNAVYADDRDIAVISTGRLPLRPAGTDLRLPTRGEGRHEWRGFLPARRLPQGTNPRDGSLVNWNNKIAPGFAASDRNFQWGPVFRVQLLERALDERRRHTLASVTGAMNQAATQDLRVIETLPEVERVLAGGSAPSPRAQRMLALLGEYRRTGAHRLDLDGDGKVDHPGAAIADAAWQPMVEAVLRPVLGPRLRDLQAIAGTDASPRTDFTGGGLSYLDKDLRTVLGDRVRGRFSVRFCGRGNLARCRRALWAAMEAAGNRLALAQGPDPSAWRADANAERIRFAPGLLPTTIRYTNRPSGIQQVISFGGHRPR